MNEDEILNRQALIISPGGDPVVRHNHGRPVNAPLLGASARLPDFPLGEGPLARKFRARGLQDFRTAARHVEKIPYGRIASPADFAHVLVEQRGTCSTKHALVAALAAEHEVPCDLWLGFFVMDAMNTPKIETTLRQFGMAAILEAHCYIKWQNAIVDLTGIAPGAPLQIRCEAKIAPHRIGEKAALHRRALEQWLQETKSRHDLELAWKARKACIGALS